MCIAVNKVFCQSMSMYVMPYCLSFYCFDLQLMVAPEFATHVVSDLFLCM